MSEFIDAEHNLPHGTVARFIRFLQSEGLTDAQIEQVADTYLQLADDLTKVGIPTTPEYLYTFLNRASSVNPDAAKSVS